MHDIVTVLPELLKAPLEASIMKPAIGLVRAFHNLRDILQTNKKSVDDYRMAEEVQAWS
jgi:tRNA G37 N-methylase TrmD